MPYGSEEGQCLDVQQRQAPWGFQQTELQICCRVFPLTFVADSYREPSLQVIGNCIAISHIS